MNIGSSLGDLDILIIDDDAAMRNMVVSYFDENGLRAGGVASGRDAAHYLPQKTLRLIVLDLQLGQEDGLSLLREIRTKSDVPVIIITGNRRDEIDRIVGLELGADDYVIKPFNLRELLARVRAVLRRQEIGRVIDQKDPERGGYTFEGWRLDRRHRRLTDPNGEVVSITKGEYALLLAFLKAPRRPLSREQLLQATRIHEDVFDRSIDVQVLRLRRKLEADPASPKMIRTERGFGYIFDVSVEPY